MNHPSAALPLAVQPSPRMEPAPCPSPTAGSSRSAPLMKITDTHNRPKTTRTTTKTAATVPQHSGYCSGNSTPAPSPSPNRCELSVIAKLQAPCYKLQDTGRRVPKHPDQAAPQTEPGRSTVSERGQASHCCLKTTHYTVHTPYKVAGRAPIRGVHGIVVWPTVAPSRQMAVFTCQNSARPGGDALTAKPDVTARLNMVRKEKGFD